MFRRGHLEERSEGTGEARKAFHNPRRCQRAGTVRKLLASDREPDEKLASGYRHGRLEPNRRRAHHARSPSGSLIGHHASRPSPNDQLALAHHRATNGGQVRYEEGSGPPRLQPLMETLHATLPAVVGLDPDAPGGSRTHENNVAMLPCSSSELSCHHRPETKQSVARTKTAESRTTGHCVGHQLSSKRSLLRELAPVMPSLAFASHHRQEGRMNVSMPPTPRPIAPWGRPSINHGQQGSLPHTI
ncbi:hypothetical protein PCL_03930 [Purpureocillium lilacinum]|uniref:Uncharacterized protein n=1 Tax=Purpureocillium lilacinum TaxID=33203 RepID=A0A2U3EQF6_PURLI|nr:hypothetical protein PCL_03930 [Purpureocillium lilacinum]